jgi:thiol-disulfide isomerase/thioredoxin
MDYLLPIGLSIIVVSLMIGLYYALRGVMPGARMIITEPPPEDRHTSSTPTFMFFYTTWCPHSQSAQAPWSSFKQYLKDHPMTNAINFEEIDADAQKDKANLYKVTAYPCFKLKTKNKVYEFIGKPSTPAFKAFVNRALNIS